MGKDLAISIIAPFVPPSEVTNSHSIRTEGLQFRVPLAYGMDGVVTDRGPSHWGWEAKAMLSTVCGLSEAVKTENLGSKQEAVN